MSSANGGNADASGATALKDSMEHMVCAACGKTGEGLKRCTACNSVRYCDVDCQRRHRKAHQKECRRLEREAKLDAAVSAALAAKEDCPICMLPLPLDISETMYKACCGKTICTACYYQQYYQAGKEECPFCRTLEPDEVEASLKQIQERVDRDDPHAMHYLAPSYVAGVAGCNDFPVQKDDQKALTLLQRSAELGNPESILLISDYYRKGLCGLEQDEQMAKAYLDKAASIGNYAAFFNLGIYEKRKNDMNMAIYYFRISASLGCEEGLKKVKLGYMAGFASKEEFAKTLRAYQQAQDEMRSTAREILVKAEKSLEDESG